MAIIQKSDLTDKIKRSFFQDWEKAWRQLHKNVTNNIEQILEATPHKTAAIRLPATHLSKLHEPDMQDTAGEVGTSS